MSTRKKNLKFNFTQSFKNTVQRYDDLSAGKKADYTRSYCKNSTKSQQTTTKEKIAS